MLSNKYEEDRSGLGRQSVCNLNLVIARINQVSFFFFLDSSSNKIYAMNEFIFQVLPPGMIF